VVEVPTVSIEATSPIAEETSAPLRRLRWLGRFVISRTGPTNQSLPVFVRYGGTAIPGTDYQPLPMRVTIPAGAPSVELVVDPIQDDLEEPFEVVEASLANCPPDTDPPLGAPCFLFYIEPAHERARVLIRDDGLTTASMEMNSPAPGAVFSPEASIPLRATAIDLDGAITHVEFFDGERQIGESTIFFFVEPPPGTPIEHEFVWTGASTGKHVLTARATSASGQPVVSPSVSIEVGPPRPELPLVSILATVPETTEPSPTSRIRPAVFTLQRTGNLEQTLRVFVNYGGTATSSNDYVALPYWVEIPSGTSTVDLVVVALDDALVEGDETVTAMLTPSPLAVVPNYRIDPDHNQARVVIHDNDEVPPATVVSIVAVDPFASEGTNALGRLNSASMVIRRLGPTNAGLTVQYALSGTAANGVDYERLSGSLELAAGRHTARLVINPLEDGAREGAESVVVTLVADMADPATGPVPYRVGVPARAAALILDNDTPRPPCVQLPDGLFNLCVPVESLSCLGVEGTGDLVHWTPLCTIPLNEGAAHYIDPDAGEWTHRFYRLVPKACEPED